MKAHSEVAPAGAPGASSQAALYHADRHTRISLRLATRPSEVFWTGPAEELLTQGRFRGAWRPLVFPALDAGTLLILHDPKGREVLLAMAPPEPNARLLALQRRHDGPIPPADRRRAMTQDALEWATWMRRHQGAGEGGVE